MPKLNRRRFLQVLSATGLAPAMPAFAASATTTTAAGLTTSQMLWGSLYAQAGSVQNMGGISRGMGISATATHSVYTKLIQNHALTAHGTSSLTRIARPAPPPTMAAAPVSKATAPRQINVDLDRLLGDDIPAKMKNRLRPWARLSRIIMRKRHHLGRNAHLMPI